MSGDSDSDHEMDIQSSLNELKHQQNFKNTKFDDEEANDDEDDNQFCSN